LPKAAVSNFIHTMGEFVKPDDLIGVCIWLASDTLRFITEAIIPVDD